MPRLAVDEPPQHGTATGTYVDNTALAARRTASKKRPSPSTGSGSGSGPTKKTKTRQFPSPRSQAEIAVIHTQNMALPKKKRRTASKALAEQFNVGASYPRSTVSRVVKKKELTSRKGVGGYNTRITADDAKMIRSTLQENAYQLSWMTSRSRWTSATGHTRLRSSPRCLTRRSVSAVPLSLRAGAMILRCPTSARNARVMSREKVALCGTLLYFLKLQCTQHTQ